MKREIIIRVLERTPATNPDEHPNERDIYTFARTIDLDEDNVFDVFDEAKMEASEALVAESYEEAITQAESLHDDEDRLDDAAKAAYRHKQYGDPL